MRLRAIQVALTAIALAAALPARAEVGPCKADRPEMMLCGSGVGAARTIPDTLSPDKTIAFAWHAPGSEPDIVEDFENEWLLIRVADGAVLTRAPTDFFQTPTLRANRRHETAIWSADSRMVVRQYDTRYDTEVFTLYRIDGNSGLAGETDLLKLVEPAVRARAKGRGRDIASYGFSIGNAGPAIGPDGRLAFDASLFIPKADDNFEFRVTLQIARDGRARILSIRENPR
jgi:hypothetical protein